MLCKGSQTGRSSHTLTRLLFPVAAGERLLSADLSLPMLFESIRSGRAVPSPSASGAPTACVFPERPFCLSRNGTGFLCLVTRVCPARDRHLAIRRCGTGTEFVVVVDVVVVHFTIAVDSARVAIIVMVRRPQPPPARSCVCNPVPYML